MQRKLLKAISVGMLLSLVSTTGCGLIGKRDKRSESSIQYEVPTIQELKSASTLKLKFAHAMGGTNQGLIDKYITSFKTEFPNVEIEQVPYSGYPALETAVAQSLISGTNNPDAIPDIIQAYPDHLAGYMKLDKVIPLSNFIESEDAGIGLTGDYDYDDFAKNYMEELKNLPLKGEFGLPFNKSSEMLVYNKTVLEEVGFDIPDFDKWTWDDVIEASQKIRNYEVGGVKIYGGDDVMPFMYDSQANAAITLGQQWGGKYTSDTGTNLEDYVLFHKDKKFKDALNFYLEQSKAGLFSFPGYLGESYASNLFLAKRNFMYIGSTAGVNYGIPTDLGNPGSFYPGIAAIPQKKGGVKQVIQQGTNVALLYKNSSDQTKNKTFDLQRLASWLFIRHLTNAENTWDWAKNTGYMAVRKSVQDSQGYKDFQANNDVNKSSYYVAQSHKVVLSQMDYLYYSPAFDGSSKIREEIGNAFDSIVLGGKTTDEALDKAYSNIKNV